MATCLEGRREASRCGTQGPVDTDLTEEERAAHLGGAQVPHGGSAGEHEGEVQALARLAPRGRGEVQVQPPWPGLQSAGTQDAREPAPALAQDRVW